MKDRAIFDLETFDNTMMFCNNCANILTVFFNVDGVSKVHCPKCGCDMRVTRFRRNLRTELYPPKGYTFIDIPGYVHFNTKTG